MIPFVTDRCGGMIPCVAERVSHDGTFKTAQSWVEDVKLRSSVVNVSGVKKPPPGKPVKEAEFVGEMAKAITGGASKDSTTVVEPESFATAPLPRPRLAKAA